MKTSRWLLFILTTILTASMLIMLGGCGSGGGGGSTVNNNNTNAHDNEEPQGQEPDNEEVEKVTITGTVLDDGGNPVANAQVTIYSDPVTVTTDSNGFFSVEVEAGDHEIEIVKYGVVIYSDTFSCGEGDTVEMGSIESLHDGTPEDPEDPGTVPSAPQNVSAYGGNAQVALNWSPVDGAESYNVYMGTASGVSEDAYVEVNNSVSSPYVWMGLTNSTDYYFVVTAVNDAGESDESGEVGEVPEILPEGEDYTELTKLLASSKGSGDIYSFDVAIDGDYAIVSQREGWNGAAYIFRRTGSNTWDSGTKITVPDEWDRNRFGNSVAISGDYVIVGAKKTDTYDSAGSAFIFRRTGINTWDSGTKIVSPNPGGWDGFGVSVSISGDYAIVGAASYTTGRFSGNGTAYIFRRTGENAWDSVVQIKPDISSFWVDNFGRSVAISGDYAIVGDPGNNKGGSDAGAVFIFKRTGENMWDSGTMIMAYDAEEYNKFGGSVAIDGDYAIVGDNSSINGETRAGAAYIFRRTGENAWDSGTKITASDADSWDFFGNSVSISGDYAVVGASSDDEGESAAGAAYIFKRFGTNTWDSGTKVMASDARRDAYLGRSVAVSGEYVIVGAPGNSYVEPGAYIFQESSKTESVPVSPKNVDVRPGDGSLEISWSPVSGASGYNIYLGTESGVSAGNYDELASSASNSYVWDGLTNITVYYIVVTAVNGNGESAESDEAIGTPISFQKIFSPDTDKWDDLGASTSISGDYAIVGYSSKYGGAVYIFRRTSDNTWDEGNKIEPSDVEFRRSFGRSVHIDGDYAIVGDPDDYEGGTVAGAAYIFRRTGDNTWDSGVKILAPDIDSFDFFGKSVSISGDYAIVGAEGKYPGGAAYIFRRTGLNTWDAGTKIKASNDEFDVRFGTSVFIAGDYAIIGDEGDDEGENAAGAAYIFRRTGLNTWDSGTKLMADDPYFRDNFGAAVAMSEDYAIVGTDKVYGKGAAYIFRRTGLNTWDSGTKIVASDTDLGESFGVSVAINGDYAIVGDVENSIGGFNAGAIYVFKRTGINTWDSGSIIQAYDTVNGDVFGSSVALSDNIFIVGAPGAGDGGSVYISDLDQ